MEKEKDPFEGTATPVGLTPPSVSSRPCIVNSTPQVVNSPPSTLNSTPSSVNLTPPRSDSACDEQEEKDPFEGTFTPVGLTPPSSDKILQNGNVYGSVGSRSFVTVNETSTEEIVSSENVSGSSKYNGCEPLKEGERVMYIIEDSEPNQEKRNVLYDLITEAIMETNSGLCTKGFCTLQEIYDYISKLCLVGLSSRWKDEVFDILYEKRTDFIHIPCGNRPFQEGSWTLHPLVARNHKTVKRSPLKNLNGSRTENQSGIFSKISTDCNNELNGFPVVRVSRCPGTDSFALANVKTQVKTVTELEAGEHLPWYGWRELSETLVVKKKGMVKASNTNKKKDRQVQSTEHSTTLKRKADESDTTNAKKQRILPKSPKKSTPTSANKSSSSGGTNIAGERIGVWRGWGVVSTKHRDQIMEIVNQLESNYGLTEVLKNFDQPNTLNQLGGLTRLYFKDPKVLYECQKSSTKVMSNDDYVDLVQQQLKELLKEYAHTMQEPPYSFATLIVMALISSAKGKLVPEDIINFIKDKFPFYQHQRNWQHTIYVVLRWNKIFNRRCSSNCTAKNEEHEGCWKVDLITASELMERALNSRLKQESKVKPDSPVVSLQQENDSNDSIRQPNVKVVNHQKSGVLFLHQSEERQHFKENLNLNNLTLKEKDGQSHPKVNSEKMNGTSVIVFSKKCSNSPKAEVVSKASDSSSRGDVETASESILLLAKSVESDQNKIVYEQTSQGKENSTSCQFCQKRFTCGFMLECHVNNHLAEPCNPCFLCHKFFPSAYELWVHMKKNHANKDNLHSSSALCHMQV